LKAVEPTRRPDASRVLAQRTVASRTCGSDCWSWPSWSGSSRSRRWSCGVA